MPPIVHEQTTEKTDYICDQLVEGRSLRSICSADDLPSVGTFLRWVSRDKALAEQYASARDIQMDYFADDINQIADDVLADGDHIQKAKLRIDTRKWTAAKLKPQKYGDNLKVQHSGGISIVRLDEQDEGL